MWTHQGLKWFFPSQTQFLQFVWIFSNKIHSKINLFHTLIRSEKNCEIKTLLNLACRQGLSNNTTSTYKFPIQFSISMLLKFSLRKWQNKITYLCFWPGPATNPVAKMCDRWAGSPRHGMRLLTESNWQRLVWMSSEFEHATS
jgi:hypothetical protein